MIWGSVRLYELKRRAASVLFPNRCPFCGELIGAKEYYCWLCRKYLPFFRGKADAPGNVSRLSVVCRYTMRARRAVLSMKYGGLVYPADTFAFMMSEKLRRDRITADMLVPVPSGFLSVKKRGFAAANLLAERMSLRLGIPLVEAVAARDCKAEQKQLSVKKRAENAKNAFYLKENADVRGKRIIIVDDVSTTGSTLSVVADLLLSAGAEEVEACVFAQAVRRAHADGGIARLKIRGRRGFMIKGQGRE